MMKRALVVVFVVAALSCTSGPEGFLQIPGWTPEGEASTYDPAGLWELINGAADTFLSYGFESVTVQNYSQDGVTAMISVYDMGRPLNAFGMYRTEAPAEETSLPIGTEAVVSPPYQCLLLKDRFYTKVEAYEGEIDQATGEALVSAIADALPGIAGLPPQFAALPTDGMVPGSSQYTREALYGLAELNECVHAAYADDAGSEYQIFALMTPDEQAAEDSWKKLAAVWQQTDLDGVAVLFREVPYSGFIGVISTDGRILGVANAANKEQLLIRLGRFSAR
jgi:hypothetical protein